MPRRGPHAALAAVLLMLGACLLIAGCGEEGSNPELLSEKTANALLDDLEEAEAAFEDGDCAKMQRRLDKVLERINDLGGPISNPLKLNLREGAQTLMDTAEAECGEATEPAPEPEPVPAPEPETPEEQPDSEDEEEPTPDETNPDQPEEPAPEPEPAPDPEPAPEPDVDPAPDPGPPPTTPAPPSGGVGPGSEAG